MGTSRSQEKPPWGCLLVIILVVGGCGYGHHIRIQEDRQRPCRDYELQEVIELADKNPELKPFVTEMFADGKITSIEYDKIMDQFKNIESLRLNKKLATELLE